MAEKKQIDFTKTNQSVYLTKAKLRLLEENCVVITGREPEDIPTMADYLMLAADTALGETKHLTTAMEKLNKQLVEKDKEIERLQSKESGLQYEIDKNKALEAELQQIKDAFEQTEERIAEHLKTVELAETEIAELKAKLAEKDSIVSEASATKEQISEEVAEKQSEIDKLKAEIERLNRAIPLNLSALQKQIAIKYLSNRNVLASLEKLNQNGKYDGVFDSVADKEVNIAVANLLKTVFMGSVHGLVLEHKLYSKSQLKSAINKFIQRNEQK